MSSQPADLTFVNNRMASDPARNQSHPAKLAEIQSSLKTAGFDPGRTDGVMTTKSFSAVQAYQQSKNPPVDSGRYINVATVKALAVGAK